MAKRTVRPLWWTDHGKGVEYVQRFAGPNPCEDCAPLDRKIVPADSAEAQTSHPHCQCDFSPVTKDGEPLTDIAVITAKKDKPVQPQDRTAKMARDAIGQELFAAAPNFSDFLDMARSMEWVPAEEDIAHVEAPDEAWFEDDSAEFAGKGNRGNISGFARYWKDKMGGGSGRPGDFNECVQTLSGKKGIKDPKALCAWWHKQSTGARPGKAAAEMSRMDGELTATFARDGKVVRKGKIFEVGVYPKQQYEMTAEEVTASAAVYQQRAPGKIAHIDTVLDGALGELVAFGMMDDGKGVWGEVEMSPEADLLLPPSVPVSVGWHRVTKQPIEISFELDPQVADAAVAVFAKRHDTTTGQYHVQALHDRTVAAGAQCKANMASGHEKSFIQDTHDQAVSHGAKCENAPGERGGMSYPMFSREPQRRGPMSWITDFFKGAGQQMTPEQKQEAIAAFSSTQGVTTPATPPPAAVTTVTAESEEAKENRQLKAAAFAKQAVTDEKATPAQEEALTAIFARALVADKSSDVARFSQDEPPLVDLVTKFFADAPKHGLTAEGLDPNDVKTKRQLAAMNRQTTVGINNPALPTPPEQQMSDERRAELLGATPMGKKILEITRSST